MLHHNESEENSLICPQAISSRNDVNKCNAPMLQYRYVWVGRVTTQLPNAVSQNLNFLNWTSPFLHLNRIQSHWQRFHQHLMMGVFPETRWNPSCSHWVHCPIKKVQAAPKICTYEEVWPQSNLVYSLFLHPLLASRILLVYKNIWKRI